MNSMTKLALAMKFKSQPPKKYPFPTEIDTLDVRIFYKSKCLLYFLALFNDMELGFLKANKIKGK